MGETILFSVGVVNDAHMRFGGRDFGAARAKFAAVMDRIASGKGGPAPEILIQLGDLVEEPRREFFEGAAEIMDRVGARVLHVPGNHDLNPEGEQPWGEALGAHPNSAVMHRGIMFVALNNAFADVDQNSETAGRNEWFRDLLERSPGIPKVIACHVPLVDIRDGATLEKSFGYASYHSLDERQTLRRLIEAHRERVLAVVSGHLHLSGHVVENGVHHFVASGSYSWPGDHLRLDFFEGAVVARMVPLEPFIESEDFAGYRLQNAAHDKHGIEFTDARHATLEEYIRGNAEERVVVVGWGGETNTDTHGITG